MEDPQAQDMRDEALKLIAASSKKLVALVHFSRIAFGAATSSESFSARELNKVLNDMFESLRAQLAFDIAGETLFDKPAARALLNLGLLIGNSLPMGGTARLTLAIEGTDRVLTGEGTGPRARFKPEAIEGLAGQPLGDGLSGQWIQPFWLYSTVSETGGHLSVESDTDRIRVCARLPLPVATIQN
jgi:histidine phosphotransferase ChpT